MNKLKSSTYTPELNSDELGYLMALNASESFKRHFATLLESFKTFEKIYKSTEDDFLGVPGIGKQSAAALARIKKLFKPGLGLERIQGKGIRLLSFWDSAYPERLREIPVPPPLLYISGDISYDFDLSIGIVGTRHANRYGLDMSKKIGRELARLGFTIISGGASGIDAAAHKSAIEAKGKTFAVFGCGIDIAFPGNHRELFRNISQNGATISEFPPGIQPEPFRFPIRNRIIAGLSRGTLVIQAPVKSGALITSNYALEMGRDVLAIPGRTDDPASEGTNLLIRDGAKMVLDIDDILAAFNVIVEKRHTNEPLPELDPVNQKIVEIIGWEPVHIDEIAVTMQKPISQISSMLLSLQLDGYIKELAGKRYIRLAP